MLQLVFDYTSLASATAVLRVHNRIQARPEYATSVQFFGIALVGGTSTLPVTLAALDEFERFRDAARDCGLQAHRPTRLPPTFDTHVVGALAASSDCGAAWREAVFSAYFTDDADLGDHAVLHDLAAGVGLIGREVAAVLADTRRRAQLRRTMTQVLQRGIASVPVLDSNGTMVSAHMDDEALDALLAINS